MAVYHDDIVDIDLMSGMVCRTFVNKTIGEGDINANRFGFRCNKNGVPISLVGNTIIGHFTRADGNTIEINGGPVTEDPAFIILPDACYAIEGNFTLAIKLVGGGVTGTIRIVDGTVVNTTNGTIIDPGNVIPDLTDYLAVVDDAVEAAETVNGFRITAQLISGNDYKIVVTRS